MTYLIGIDIGGTFTDCVALDDAGRRHHAKTPSTHATSPVEGVLAGLALLAESTGRPDVEALLGATDRLCHGTTIGTNLVVERKGARVGLIATIGHGDALTMMRGNGRTAGIAIDQLFNVHATDKPRELVPRRRTVEVIERVAVDGTVLTPLDEEHARTAIAALLAEDVDAVAIALLWGFLNPVHEQRLRELVHEQRPDMLVSLGSEASPRQGEYERTVATVVNSYVGPASAAYLDEFAAAMAARGLALPPFIMQANGGVVPVSAAIRRPLHTIGSGPAGGLAGTTAVAAAQGHRGVIATDMGGTSFEVGLLIDGAPVQAREEIIDQYTFHTARLDLRSIACGGGSIASVDEHSGALRVGPESAGATPGPACYGRGTAPTVTDADLVLGLIGSQSFLGGAMTLDLAAARRAIGSVADRLGLSVEDAAAGIVHINGVQAATLIRQRTIEQGLDPRDFVLYAFGGAGPVHAFAFAEELGIDRVVVPLGNGASTLSAFGIASSDVVQVYETQVAIRAPFDAAALRAAIAELRERALAGIAELGFDAGQVGLTAVAHARYAEQLMQVIEIPVPETVDDAAVARLGALFDAEYSRLYGEGALAAFAAVEIFSLRVTATVALAGAPVGRDGAEHAGAPAPLGDRDVYWPSGASWVTTPVYDGGTIGVGREIVGPALVELPHTTVTVPAGRRLTADGLGNLVLELVAADPPQRLASATSTPR
ncbi:hydantoinase/oxoprolinase family protein [Nocardia harenae]|uniref:hydantoinase/oxoprolinase family protein n=1 Tax=Nocardia harenae TaxID=358707 RepID=UPI00082BEEDE|nr:hydantoinase/oxoprolinase family protein [Nocardia harenae]